MERGYEDQLRAAKTNREVNEMAGYPEDVKLFASSLLEMGEDILYIARLLDIEPHTVSAWHHTFTTQLNFVLREDEFTFIREKNVLRTDARTKGAIVKACIEDGVAELDAATLIGVTEDTVKRWKVIYARDYERMIPLLPGCDLNRKSVYVMSLAHKEELQELIFRHDAEESVLATTRRMEYLQQRNTDV